MFKNIYNWLPCYIFQKFYRYHAWNTKPIQIIFSIVDHFEPNWKDAILEKEIERTDCWISKYTKIISCCLKTNKIQPRYTFFYPTEKFQPIVFKRISDFCKKNLGEIEIHLHHQNDTAESLKNTLIDAKELYRSYGNLCKNKLSGEIQYAFIHGNWALDNSRQDGRWCGVNSELEILNQTGCYADFTLPSAPSDTQTRTINSIYYAKDDPERPKSHNTGRPVTVGGKPWGDLMLIQGPLALNWKRRKWGILPRIENAEITLENPPTPDRVDLWIKQHISVKGRPEWIFVKVHTHGCQDKNLTDEYFRNLASMFSYLETRYNDNTHYKLNYVTAREMYNIIKAAEAGETGDPQLYKDYLLIK